MLEDLILELVSNPLLLVIFIVQICLGVVMGFFMRKAVKAVVAITACIIVGGLLEVWNVAQLWNVISKELEITPEKLSHIWSVLTQFYGLMGILPISIGICVGFILAGKW